MTYQIIIHGGANNLIEEDAIRKQHCEEIADKIEQLIKKGKNALDACEEGVKMLEDDPIFNAGTGAYVQIDGKCRMDACIMDSNLKLGSVIQVSNVKNPISIARILLEDDVHSTLAGHGASLLAQERGFKLQNNVTEDRLMIHLRNMRKLKNEISYKNLTDLYKSQHGGKLGTVGCVIRDKNGYIAAGTSTGGLETCFPGRVGDTPLVGCGNYTNKYVGVSCTGIGEKIMRVTLARNVAFHVEEGMNLKNALKRSIQELEKIEGVGGIIAISHKGEIEYDFNTRVMSYATRKG